MRWLTFVFSLFCMVSGAGPTLVSRRQVEAFQSFRTAAKVRFPSECTLWLLTSGSIEYPHIRSLIGSTLEIPMSSSLETLIDLGFFDAPAKIDASRLLFGDLDEFVSAWNGVDTFPAGTLYALLLYRWTTWVDQSLFKRGNLFFTAISDRPISADPFLASLPSVHDLLNTMERITPGTADYQGPLSANEDRMTELLLQKLKTIRTQLKPTLSPRDLLTQSIVQAGGIPLLPIDSKRIPADFFLFGNTIHIFQFASNAPPYQPYLILNLRGNYFFELSLETGWAAATAVHGEFEDAALLIPEPLAAKMLADVDALEEVLRSMRHATGL